MLFLETIYYVLNVNEFPSCPLRRLPLAGLDVPIGNAHSHFHEHIAHSASNEFLIIFQEY